MKVLHINTIDTGGAAIAAIRLHYLLLENGIESRILFLKRASENAIREAYYFEDLFRFKSFFRLKEKLNAIYNRRFTFFKPQVYFNGPDSLFDISRHTLFQWADVVHLHWVVKFLDWGKVFHHKAKSFVWTFHDMNPMTGGEHYLTGYENAFPGVERLNIIKKKAALKGTKLSVITPSLWLSSLVNESEIFRNFSVKTVKNPVDINIFKPRDITGLRKKYHLPADKKVVLFVAENPGDIRKGYLYLMQSLEKISVKHDFHLAVIGKKSIQPGSLKATLFGTIKEEHTLSDLYNCADLFVIPSIEDNLPNTVSEALLCGTPVAGFDTGGIPDMVKPGLNGCLADGLERLDEAILNAIEGNFDRQKIREMALSQLNPSLLLDEFMSVYKQ